MAIASGTQGTCRWEISDSGVLTIYSGNLESPYYFFTSIYENLWGWGDYAEQITSCVIKSGVTIVKGSSSSAHLVGMFNKCRYMETVEFEGTFDTASVTDMDYMFGNCESLQSVTFPSGFATTNVSSMNKFFYGCSNITTLDLSMFETSSVAEINGFFTGCELLSSITFGNSFDLSGVEYDFFNDISIISDEYKEVVNTSTGLVVTSNEDFMALPSSSISGTWRRTASSTTYTVTAVRSTGSVEDEDGEDALITVTWVSSDGGTITVYKKLASASSYEQNPTSTTPVTGDSGITRIPVSSLGDDAWDFRVEFDDGEYTYIAFPSISANVKLTTVDEDGNVEIFGDLKVDGDITSPRKTLSFTSQYVANIFVERWGKVVSVTLNNMKSVPNGQNITLFTLPEGWRPSHICDWLLRNPTDTYLMRIVIQVSGAVDIYNYGSSTTAASTNATQTCTFIAA